MVRGTTPLHTFVFPVDVLDNYANMLITYRQNNHIKLEKVLSDLDINGKMVSIRLAQEETLLFDVGRYFVQVKVFTKDGRVQASGVFGAPVTSVLSDSLIDEDTVVDPMVDIKCTNIIIRGTTPIIFFEPKHIPTQNFEVATLTIKQNGLIVLQKDIDEAEVINDMFVWYLTEEETLELQPFVRAVVGCSWELANDTKGESRIMICDVYNSIGYAPNPIA